MTATHIPAQKEICHQKLASHGNPAVQAGRTEGDMMGTFLYGPWISFVGLVQLLEWPSLYLKGTRGLN